MRRAEAERPRSVQRVARARWHLLTGPYGEFTLEEMTSRHTKCEVVVGRNNGISIARMTDLFPRFRAGRFLKNVHSRP